VARRQAKDAEIARLRKELEAANAARNEKKSSVCTVQ
jgi:hypothetical protein